MRTYIILAAERICRVIILYDVMLCAEYRCVGARIRLTITYLVYTESNFEFASIPVNNIYYTFHRRQPAVP